MERTLLQLRTELEEYVTRREAMIVANQEREHRGEAMAYSEDDFNAIVGDLVNLNEQIRNL